MNKRCLLVDTCNMLHRFPHLRDRMVHGIDLAVEQFLTELRPLHDLDHWELHLVVDGKGSRMEQCFVDDLRTLSVVYAPFQSSADTIIESWLLRLGTDWQVRVASEDLSIVRAAIASKAEPLSSIALMQWLDSVLTRFRNARKPPPPASFNSFANKLEGLS